MNARYLPYVLITPVALFFMCVFPLPILFGGRVRAFGDGGSGFSLDNFRAIFGYWKFNTTLTNTLLLAAAVVPVQLAMALLMATMVSRMGKGRDLVLYIWTIPPLEFQTWRLGSSGLRYSNNLGFSTL